MKLTPRNLHLLEKSLAFALERYHEAEAVADAALHEVADFACAAKFTRKEAVEKLAALNMIAYEAEQGRRVARGRLIWELAEYAKATDPEGADYP